MRYNEVTGVWVRFGTDMEDRRSTEIYLPTWESRPRINFTYIEAVLGELVDLKGADLDCDG